MSRLLLLCSLAVLAFPALGHAQDSTKAPKPKRNPDLISQEEVAALPDAARTALDIVQQLRPNWLRVHGQASIRNQTPDPQVYVAGMRRGGPRELGSVERAAIKEIQHLRGTDASQRFGMGHESGAIIVILK